MAAPLVGSHKSQKLPSYARFMSNRAGGRTIKNWPLSHQCRHFEIGHVLNCAITDSFAPAKAGTLSAHHAGLWECDLASGNVIWSGGVYDIFGIERGQTITRDRALSLYADECRDILERLRGNAINLGHGFTVDVQIYPELIDEPRWVRIIAAPVIEGDAVTRLHGIKLALQKL